MKKHTVVEIIQRHRSDSGRLADHAQLLCPCGRKVVVAIDDCPVCGPAISAHTIDGEVLCDSCGSVYSIDTEMAVHCSQQYSESCKTEGDIDD